MADIQHPALGLEARRLSTTLKAIDDEVRSLRQLGWSGGAVAHAAFQAQKWAWDKSDRLLEIRSNPYFGRIDVDGDRGKVESFYIGPEGLAGPSRGERLIIDWRAPISAAFYRPDGQTALRRRIDIKQSLITRIVDDFVRDSDRVNTERGTQADPILHDILSEARGGSLGSIVRTIQAKQDEIIRTTDSVTVVQGAAGTGKTVVALHRLAYLLYQARISAQRDDEDPQPGYVAARRRITDRSASELKVAVFGPNRAYLRHIRTVLPSLGENTVVQTTFEEWVLASLADEGLRDVPSRDDLEDILDSSASRDDRERLFRRARAKGAIEMGQMLDRYVKSELATRDESLRR